MIEKIGVWLREPVTAQGRTRAWRIWFWGVQLPLAGLVGSVIGIVLGGLLIVQLW